MKSVMEKKQGWIPKFIKAQLFERLANGPDTESIKPPKKPKKGYENKDPLSINFLLVYAFKDLGHTLNPQLPIDSNLKGKII